MPTPQVKTLLSILAREDGRWFQRGEKGIHLYQTGKPSLSSRGGRRHYLSPTCMVPRQLNTQSHLGSPSTSNPHESWLGQRPTSGPKDFETQFGQTIHAGVSGCVRFGLKNLRAGSGRVVIFRPVENSTPGVGVALPRGSPASHQLINLQHIYPSFPNTHRQIAVSLLWQIPSGFHNAFALLLFVC